VLEVPERAELLFQRSDHAVGVERLLHPRQLWRKSAASNGSKRGKGMRTMRRDVSVSGGGWEPNERYPDPAVKILDPSFEKYRVGHASVERLYTGARWVEGPVWFGDARCVLFSDIPNNRICVGMKRQAVRPFFGSRRTTPTATPVIARAGLLPASTMRGV
jgi:hypothetical protein